MAIAPDVMEHKETDTRHNKLYEMDPIVELMTTGANNDLSEGGKCYRIEDSFTAFRISEPNPPLNTRKLLHLENVL